MKPKHFYVRTRACILTNERLKSQPFPHLIRQLKNRLIALSSNKVSGVRSTSVNKPAFFFSDGKNIDFGSHEETQQSRNSNPAVAIFQDFFVIKKVLGKCWHSVLDTFVPDSFKRWLGDVILLDSNVVDAHLEPCHSSILAMAEPLVKDRHLFTWADNRFSFAADHIWSVSWNEIDHLVIDFDGEYFVSIFVFDIELKASI